MEDQTDEDFFDNLIVDDDDVYKPTASLSFVDGSGLDDVKAFANLSITDNAGNGIESSEKVVKEDVSYEGVEALKKEVVDLSVKQVGSLLVPSNPLAFYGVIESDSGLARVNGTVDIKESENAGLGAQGIKEVQWSAFGANFSQNGGNEFESFSDFFTEIGDNTYELVGKRDGLVSESKVVSGSHIANSAFVENSNGCIQFHKDQLYGTTTEQSTDVQDVSSSQHWKNLYPGWNYDANNGQFCQVEGCYDATANVQGGLDSNDLSVTNEKAGVSYLQQTAQPALEAIAEGATTESVTSLKPISQAGDNNESISIQIQPSKENNGYPSHMFFDRQYPGWYYDMIAQEWCTLDTYNFESTVQDHNQDQLNQNRFVSDGISHNNELKKYVGYGQSDTYVSEGFSSQGQDYNCNGSYANVIQQSSNMWQPDAVAKNVVSADSNGNRKEQSQYGTNLSLSNRVSQQSSYDYGGTNPSYRNDNQLHCFQQTFQGGYSQQQSQSGFSQQQVQGGYTPQLVQRGFSQHSGQSGPQFSYVPAAGRSSDGRPSHALVTFGFGGKLIVMKDSTSLGPSFYGSHDTKRGSLSVLNLAEVVTRGASSGGASDYFNTLCRHTFPSPLTGGSADEFENDTQQSYDTAMSSEQEDKVGNWTENSLTTNVVELVSAALARSSADESERKRIQDDVEGYIGQWYEAEIFSEVRDKVKNGKETQIAQMQEENSLEKVDKLRIQISNLDTEIKENLYLFREKQFFDSNFKKLKLERDKLEKEYRTKIMESVESLSGDGCDFELMEAILC